MNESHNHINHDINLKDLFLELIKRKLFVILLTLFAAILSIFISLSLPDIYKSEAILSPSSHEDSLSSKIGGLSTLGSFAGFSMQQQTLSKSQEAIERIKSYEFFSSYFLPQIKLENIIAVEKWIPETNTLIYDDRLYLDTSDEWIRSVDYPKTKIPSNQEAYEIYKEILEIKEDNQTSFIKLSIKHHSPEVAKNWVLLIIKQINQIMRNIDIEIAEKSVSYLNQTAASTNIQSIKEAITTLLENQMQTLMLASSNEAYVFKTLDSPISPEYRSEPNRVLICILGTLLGFMISVFIVTINYFRFKI